MQLSCRCSSSSALALVLACGCSSCTADVLAALLPHTLQRERPVQRSALSATALTCTAAGAHEMFRRRRQQMLWPQPRAARLLENFEPFARRQKHPFACTFLACGFEHQKPKRCAFSRSGEPTQCPSVPHTLPQPTSRFNVLGEPQHYHDYPLLPRRRCPVFLPSSIDLKARLALCLLGFLVHCMVWS